MFRKNLPKVLENAASSTPAPLRVPVSIEVKMGEPIDGHLTYKVRTTAPTLGKQWSVTYRFKHFRDVYDALSKEDSKAITVPFPDANFKSKLGAIGVKLSGEEQAVRLTQLQAWLEELISKRGGMGPVTLAILNGFLNFSNLSELELEALVLTQATSSPGCNGASPGSAGSSPSSSSHGSGGSGSGRGLGPPPESPARRHLRAGVPLLQHKHRVSKMGALSSRNRILRLTRDGLCLVLIEAVEGSGYVESKRVELTDVAAVLAGAQTPVLSRVVKGAPLPATPARRGSTFSGPAGGSSSSSGGSHALSTASSSSSSSSSAPTLEEQAAREAMCFSVVPIEGGTGGSGSGSGDGGGETWDLELSPLFADEEYLGQPSPGASLGAAAAASGAAATASGGAAAGRGGASAREIGVAGGQQKWRENPFNASPRLPNFSFRDQIVAELSTLIGSNREMRFAPCAAFAGARRGFVFKLGDFGVGYYPDRKKQAP